MNSLTATPMITYAPQSAGAPVEITVTLDDVRDCCDLVYYQNPERFFAGKRPLRIIQSPPPLVTYRNVIYTPAVRGGPKERLGCLYDEAGNQIQEALTFRGRNDNLFNTDPPRYEGPVDELPEYDRPVLYMNHIRPHFGHFIYESLGNWWPLTEELGDVDRFLFHVYNPALLERPYVKACLEAVGIQPEQLLYFDKPIRLKEVIVPKAAMQLKSHVYTKYRDIMTHISRELGAEVLPSEETDQPVYLSKTLNNQGVRRYLGEEKVEAFLKERGVRIVHPQTLPLAEQFRVVNQHRTVLGFQGSQMGNLMGALNPRRVVIFTEQKLWPGRFLTTMIYGNHTSFVMVSESARKFHTLYNTAMRRVLGRKTQYEGFDKFHAVDHQRAIAWLKKSGLV